MAEFVTAFYQKASAIIIICVATVEELPLKNRGWLNPKPPFISPPDAAAQLHIGIKQPGYDEQRALYSESFNARFCDELLNGDVFYSLREAQILIEQWRKH